MAYELNDTLSPLSRPERNKVNENWRRIENALNSLQNQVSVIAGGDISDIIDDLNDAMQRLDEMLNEGETLIDDLDGAILVVNGYIDTLEEYVPRMEDGVTDMEALLPVLTNLRDELTTLNNNATIAENGRVSAEGTRVTNENTRISNENTRQANELIRQATLEEMELLVDNFESYEYNSSMEYDFPNFVLYNGSTYLALQRVSGLTPSNDGTNWRLAAQRGVDGTGSVSSVNGIMPDANGNVFVPTGGDIINNLTSTRTDASLSANMGRQLNVDKVNVSDKATTAEMQAGTSDTKWATPLGTTNAITNRIATTSEVNAGTNTNKLISPLRLAELTGKKADLQTDDKSNIVAGLNEVKEEIDNHLVQSNAHTVNQITGLEAQLSDIVAFQNNYLVHGIAGTTTGSANVYSIAPSPALSSYSRGLRLTLFFNVANTSSSTININGLGAKTLKKNDGSVFASGDLKINTPYSFVYNGTDFLADSIGGEVGGLIEYENYYDEINGDLTKETTSVTLPVGIYNAAATNIGDYVLFGGGNLDSLTTDAVTAFDDSLIRTTATPLTAARSYLSANSTDTHALFAGGNSNVGNSNAVNAYDKNLTRLTAPNLAAAKFLLSSGKINKYVLFAGGGSNSNVVEAYDNNLIKTTPTALSSSRNKIASASTSDYVFFAGGSNGNTPVDIVDVYNNDLVRTTITPLSTVGTYTEGATAGEYVLFAGTLVGNVTSNVVQGYDSSLVKINNLELTTARNQLKASTVGKNAVFAGGFNNSSQVMNTVESFDEELVKSNITPLTTASYALSSATLGNKLFFGGGNDGVFALNSINVYSAGFYETIIPVTIGTKYSFQGQPETTATRQLTLKFKEKVNGYMKIKSGKLTK